MPKHNKYNNQYIPNDIFWGIGVEHETYLQGSQLIETPMTEIAQKRKPERYSVNYYSIYKQDDLEQAFTDLSGLVADIPTFINSHSFTHCDIQGQHKTTYTRQPQPNPKFIGETFHEFLGRHDPYFNTAYEQQFIFDGDTIEFVNLNFYKQTIRSVLAELSSHKSEFIHRLNTVLSSNPTHLTPYLPLELARENYPFAKHLTNPANYSMFNNSTLHINITLPTQLDASGQIADPVQFTNDHRNFIRILQWMEPIWIAMYGAGDIFSSVRPQRFCAGSQRLAVSRYIGIGTYDTVTMPRGKILLAKRDTIRGAEWYDTLYSSTAYTGLDHIGLDINFNKHYAHGVELRIFDGMSDANLQRVMEDCVLCGDFSLIWADQIPDIHDYPEWQDIAFGCITNGKNYIIPPNIVELYCNILDVDIPEGAYYVPEFYEAIFTHLRAQYINGPIQQKML
jgi:hypothetical protein